MKRRHQSTGCLGNLRGLQGICAAPPPKSKRRVRKRRTMQHSSPRQRQPTPHRKKPGTPKASNHKPQEEEILLVAFALEIQPRCSGARCFAVEGWEFGIFPTVAESAISCALYELTRMLQSGEVEHIVGRASYALSEYRKATFNLLSNTTSSSKADYSYAEKLLL